MNREINWKFSYHFLVSIVLTLMATLSDLLISGGSLPYLMHALNKSDNYQSTSLGIIGGADGPTAIFLTGNPWLYFLGTKVFFLLVLLALYLPTRKIIYKKLMP